MQSLAAHTYVIAWVRYPTIDPSTRRPFAYAPDKTVGSLVFEHDSDTG
jgi:hypothetical protein